ncbi:MAG: UvrD-helicase domain-containing protein [Candidatus Omnitrophota bacterium]|jgi:ATP-dependent exoDNAse (exonuclease V) beta subunit
MENNNSILTSPEVCIVEASAGSGKTYTLARRYVKLLMDGRLSEEMALKSILAITFTNKAAFEMKSRILEFLKRIALGVFPSMKEKDEMTAFLGGDERFIRGRAFTMVDEIIRRYNFFQVQTIDSFINAILSGCAFKMELSAAFRIKNDFADYLSYSLDLLIDKAAHDRKTRGDFLAFLDQYLLLENKKSWLPRNDILDIMRMLFNAANTHGKAFARYPKDLKDIRAKKDDLRGLMLQLKRCMPEEANLRTWGSFVNSFGEHTDNSRLDEFFGPFSKEAFAMRKNCLPPDEAQDLWERIKGDIKTYYEWRAFSLFNRYVDIFQGVFENLKEISHREDILFLPELNSRASRLFDTQSLTVPELYYRLAVRFRHFLIDEFQDTNNLQWRNVFPMIEEALSTGGSLFYVGDKKQAIYRFRGGDVSLMDSVREELGIFHVRTEALTKNYRSRKAIVEFNNAVFSRENLLRCIADMEEEQKGSVHFSSGDIARIVSVFSSAQQEYKSSNGAGCVQVECLEFDSGEETAEAVREKVLSLISGLRGRGFAYKDIALLTRANKEVELVTAWLLEKNIPVESEKTLNIREHFLIRELAAFLTFLNSPIDDLAFAVFILGDIFAGISGIPRDEVEGFLFKLRRERGKVHTGYLYREFRERFPEVWERFFEEFFKTVGFVPLYELTVSAFSAFRIMDNFPLYQGFFMKLLEVIKAQEEDHRNIADFLEFFRKAPAEDLYVHISGTDSVQALTVHKAKGLEFPVVIIPFLEMNVRVGSGDGSSRAFVVRPEDGTLSLNYLKKDFGDFSPELESRYRDEYTKAFIDELNNIYVACTRPQYELYIFVPRKSGNRINPARFLLPGEEPRRGAPEDYREEKSQKEAPLARIGPSRYRDWIAFLKDEYIEESVLRERERIFKGDVAHCVLSFLGNLHGREQGKALREALEKAGCRYPFIEDWKDYTETIERLLDFPGTRKFFFQERADVFQEREIVDPSGNTRRIDRLMIFPDEAWVIDYKSSRSAAEGYSEQVREYMRLAQDVYPRLKMRGFLVYLDEREVEEVS